jgi:putative PIN family toxin of toxin-antitoxin system
MIVVVDTNVLISAAWRDKTPEAVILWIANHDDWLWVVTDDILDEYREVLQREKFNLAPEVILAWIDLIDDLTFRIEPTMRVDFPRDQKDAKFLACALSASADYFVSGDRDFTEAKELTGTIILSAALFKKTIIDTE